jgi:hypothetical protein
MEEVEVIFHGGAGDETVGGLADGDPLPPALPKVYVKADILVKKRNYKNLAVSVTSGRRIDGKSRDDV